MLFQLIFFLFLILFLFFLRKKISISLYQSLYKISGSEKFCIAILAFLLLPGTIVHELSHFFAATILRIPTGTLTVFPYVEKGDNRFEVKSGALEIGKTDPFRRSLVGLAPIVSGLIIIFFIGKTLLPSIDSILHFQLSIIHYLSFYFLFAVSSMMFSSKKDLESLIIALPLVLLISASLYIIGVRIFFEENLTKTISAIISRLNTYLLLANCLDYLILLMISGVLYLLQKFSRK